MVNTKMNSNFESPIQMNLICTMIELNDFNLLRNHVQRCDNEELKKILLCEAGIWIRCVEVVE